MEWGVQLRCGFPTGDQSGSVLYGWPAASIFVPGGLIPKIRQRGCSIALRFLGKARPGGGLDEIVRLVIGED